MGNTGVQPPCPKSRTVINRSANFIQDNLEDREKCTVLATEGFLFMLT